MKALEFKPSYISCGCGEDAFIVKQANPDNGKWVTWCGVCGHPASLRQLDRFGDINLVPLYQEGIEVEQGNLPN